LARYACGLALFAFALALRLWLFPVEAGRAFLLFYPAVMIAFIYCGMGPGTLTMVLSTLAASCIFGRPAWTCNLNADTALSSGIFLLSGGLVGLTSHHMRQYRAGLSAALDRALTSQRQLERLFRATPAMLHSIDAAGRIVRVSDTWLSTLGYGREEVLGRRSSDFLTAESRERAVTEVVPEFFRLGHVEDVPYQMVCKDGRLLDVLISAVLERDAAGQPLWSIAVILDVTSRRQSESALAASEARYRVLVEDQSELVSLCTEQGLVTFANHAYARHFGRTADEMVGTSLFDYVLPDEHEAVREHLRRVCRSEGILTGENRMIAADGGGPRWFSWINRALTDPEGRMTVIHSVGRDITEQKTLESQLTATAREVEDLYDRAPCGYHSVGFAGNYLKVNATELEWIGMSREEVMGQQGPRDFVAAEDRARFNSAFLRARESGRPEVVHCRLEPRHGLRRDVSINISVVQDDEGDFLMTRSVMFDITAQKDAERALQRLNREQTAILESSLMGIAKLQARHYLWTNAGLSQMLGYAPGELIGLPTRAQHVSDEAHQALGALAYPLLRSGETFRGEVVLVQKGGERIWLEMTAAMLDLEQDVSLWMFSDITTRKTAETALRSSQSLLARTGAVAGVGGWEFDLLVAQLYWTDETCRIHGLEPGYRPEIEDAVRFYTPAARPVIEAAVEQAVARGVSYDLELPLVRADGRAIWVRTVGSIDYADGRPVRMVGALQDVTAKVEQRQHIEQLYRLADQQRTELASFRDRAESETELASFLLSRLSRIQQLDEADVAYYWEPAEAFSGDLIAVARSRAGDLYGMLADATGHGLAAAINLIPLTSAFYAMAAKGFNLMTIIDQLNKVVKEFSLPDRFVAITLARFKRRERQLEVVNAGNPAAVLLNDHGSVAREFASGSIPLGILGGKDFKPCVETIELFDAAHLLMYSDGLVEACNAEGLAFGRAGLDAALHSASAPERIVPSIRDALLRHSSGLAPADDISLLMLSASAASTSAAGAIPARLGLASGAAASPSAPSSADDRHWTVAVSLSSVELRRVEAVPVLVDLTRTLGLANAVEARFFTVLSELFQNALDHGLLGLDSAVKSGPDGFEGFLELRSERLAALHQGEITVRLAHWQRDGGGGRLRVEVSDTGPGFDHQRHLRELAGIQHDGPDRVPSGRGIALLLTLCDEVVFNDLGNQVVVEFAYS
jgi:PAS domain S-box-containing protein